MHKGNVLRWPLRRALPRELHAIRQYLVFRLRPRGENGKQDKLPHYADGSPRRGELGSKADRARLVTLVEAERACEALGFDGVGLALLNDGDLVALDLDNCINAQGPNKLAKEAAEWSYSEVSPSGNGLRVLMRDPEHTVLEDKAVTSVAEVFRGTGFVTLTGNIVHGVKHLALLDESMRERLGLIKHDAKPAGQQLISRQPTNEEDLRTLLSGIPNDDLEWDEWNKVLCACAHSGLGAKARELFVTWSKGSKKHDDQYTEREWTSWSRRNKGKVVTPATLAHMARERQEAPKVSNTAESDETPQAKLFDPFSEKIVKTEYLLEECLPKQGAFFIAGKPKSGKSWFAMQLAICAAWSADFIGFKLSGPASTLYWDTGENGKNLLVERFALCRDRMGMTGNPKKPLHVHAPDQGEEVPREDAAIDKLVELIEKYKPEIVVLDTLAGVLARKGADVYQGDYDRMRRITRIAHHFGICILVLIHDKKRSAQEDILEDKVTGSRGLTGAADGAIFLEAHMRAAKGEVEKFAAVTSSMRGARRNLDHGLQLVNGGFIVIGDASTARLSESRLAVIKAFEIAAEDAGKTPHEITLTSANIGKLIGKSAASTRDLCTRMRDAGELWSIPQIGWRLPPLRENSAKF